MAGKSTRGHTQAPAAGQKGIRQYRITVSAQHCKGCELCVAVCPKKVLEMTADLNARGVHMARAAHPEWCIACLQCTDICPDAAIQIEETVE